MRSGLVKMSAGDADMAPSIGRMRLLGARVSSKARCKVHGKVSGKLVADLGSAPSGGLLGRPQALGGRGS